MAFIQTVDEDAATGALRKLYDGAMQSGGSIPNYCRAFSHRPEYLPAFNHLLGAIKSNMTPRRYELATLAAALALRNSYCALAHSSVILDGILTEDQLSAAATDPGNSDLTPQEVAVMEFATAIVRDASRIDQSQVDKLREHGLTDPEISDIAAAASIRCFFAKYLDALGVQPDATYSEFPENLRSALVLGREIENPKG